MCKQAGYRGGIEGFLEGKKDLAGCGGCIIELSAQWSDGGHVVPLMEEEMSFLARLIVQKRALPLFREAPASLPVHLHTHSNRHSHSETHKWTLSEDYGI